MDYSLWGGGNTPSAKGNSNFFSSYGWTNNEIDTRTD